jgi:Zn-dependent metalloprotease
VAELTASSDRTPTVTTDGSGVVTSLRTAPGHPIDRSAGVRPSSGAELSARGLAREHGAAFGLRKGDAELRTTATLPAAGGLEVVRFNQTVGDVPVLGADLVVTVRPDGETISVGSTVTTATPSTTTPEVTARQAADTARAATARAEKLAKNAELTVATPELAMFDPAVFGAPGRPGLRAVWRAKVTGEFRTGPVAADVLVDARNGQVTLYANALHAALDRQVCDHKAQPVAYPGFGVDERGYYCPVDLTLGAAVPDGVVAATEGKFMAGVHADVRNAYTFAADTYDFYSTLFGRDSIDDNGMPIRSSVRYCPEDSAGGASCFENAYWDGQQMVYGPGYAGADDVVAHELTHGITQNTSNLYYWYQAGSINESMSDVFGEFVDLTNGADGRGRQTAWEMGEDIPGGAIRSMSNPAKFGDPATMTATQYRGGMADSGGVHSNSGVGNYAAYLIATKLGAGGKGISKAAHLYYQTLLTLPSGADYADLAGTLQTSCASLVGQTRPALKVASGDPATVTFDAADCTVVGNAIATTRMTTEPTRPDASAPDVPRCPDGSAVAETLFSDDMENPASGNWSLDTPADVLDATTAYYTAATSPDGSSYAHSGQTSIVGLSSESATTAPDLTVGRAQATTPITIPAGKRTYLWFAHADGLTDEGNGAGIDGGRVSAEFTGAAGTSLVDLGSLQAPAVNGYNSALHDLDGGPAFSGDSHGYVSSRFELTELAGRSVKPTFDLVGNSLGYSDWFLDDVAVYTCTGVAPGRPTAVNAKPAGADGATISWTRPDWAGDSGLRDYTVDVTPAVPGFPQTAAADATGAAAPALVAGTPYTFTVTANAVDGTAGTPVTTTLLPTGTTITNSPTTVIYAQRTTLTGTVTRPGTATPVGAVSVLVEGRSKGTTAWGTVATVKSASTGAWTTSHVPFRNYEYRATPLAGPGAWAGTPSAARVQNVAWKVNASFAASTIRVGQTATMRVSVAPGKLARFELQRRVGNAWVVVQRKNSTSKGTAYLAAKHTKAGSFTYRVVVNGDTRYVITASSARALRVR